MLSGNAVKWVQETVFLYSPSVQLLLLWLLLTIQSKSSKIVVAAIHSAVKFIGFKNIKLGPIQQCCTKFCLHEGYVIKFFFFFLLSQRCWIGFISILEAIVQCALIIWCHTKWCFYYLGKVMATFIGITWYIFNSAITIVKRHLNQHLSDKTTSTKTDY